MYIYICIYISSYMILYIYNIYTLYIHNSVTVNSWPFPSCKWSIIFRTRGELEAGAPWHCAEGRATGTVQYFRIVFWCAFLVLAGIFRKGSARLVLTCVNEFLMFLNLIPNPEGDSFGTLQLELDRIGSCWYLGALFSFQTWFREHLLEKPSLR